MSRATELANFLDYLRATHGGQLPDVLTVAGGTMEVNAAIAFANGGLFRANPDGPGIDRVCSAEYVERFKLGNYQILQPNGTTIIHEHRYVGFPLGSDDDTTQGYATGSIVVFMSTGETYRCTDASTGSALWKLEIPMLPNVRLGHDEHSWESGTTFDFDGNAFETLFLEGDVEFGTANLDACRSKTIRLVCDDTDRALAFPDWVFIGATAPTTLLAGKIAILTLTAFGTTDADVVAAYAAQP